MESKQNEFLSWKLLRFWPFLMLKIFVVKTFKDGFAFSSLINLPISDCNIPTGREKKQSEKTCNYKVI